MSVRSRISTWWRAIFRPVNLDRQVSEELQFHIESYAEDLMRGGMTREEAFRRARSELGSIAARKEDCRTAWGTRFLDELRGDLRYALRMLARSPGFTAVAVVSLALGIGANTAIFSLTKAILLDSLTVSHPEELRLLEWQVLGQSGYKNLPMQSLYGDVDFSKTGIATGMSFSYAAYQSLRQNKSVFDELMAYFHAGHVEIAVDGEVEPGTVEFVSGTFFQVLGTRAAVGRTLLPSDDNATGQSAVVVISDSLWRERFGRSPSAIGKTVEINRVPVTIVGIAPRGFHGAGIDTDPPVYIPLAMQPLILPERWDRGGNRLSDPETWWVRIMGRIRPDVSNAQAQAALNGIFRQTAKATLKHPQRVDEESMHLIVAAGNRAEAWQKDQRFLPVAGWLSALAMLVLLLACVNLANLLLARSVARQREMTVRLALGAWRARILRQMLTENMLLALLGAVAGTALGYGARNLIPRMLGEPTPAFDWKVLSFALGLSLFTGLLLGGVSAWAAIRANMQAGLQDTGRMSSRRSHALSGRLLVVAQICFSMLLLIGSGLFIRTLRNLLHVQLGFEPHHLLLFDVALPKFQYKTPEDCAAAFQAIEERLSSLPGVISASLSEEALIGSGNHTSNFDPDGEVPGSKIAWENIVGDHFFQTLGIPLLAGRDFGRQDTETSEKVAIINEQLAHQFFPGQNPIGRTFNSPHTRIIGISGNAKFSSLRDDPPPTYYLLARQNGGWNTVTFEVRTTGNPATVEASVRDKVHAFDRQLPLMNVRTQEEQIAASLREERLFALLMTVFGGLALVLASIGIYGTMAYTVSRRTNEIGVRMALGAQPGRVLQMVLGEASCLAAIGIVAGVASALGLERVIASRLYGLKAYDPATFAASAMLLVLVALAASWTPARRAADVDPMKALRHE